MEYVSFQAYAPVDPLIPMVLLYTILVHRRTYGSGGFHGNCYWSHLDLATILDHFRAVWNLCQSHRGIPELVEQTLGGHCSDPQDHKVVAALTETIVKAPEELKKVRTVERSYGSSFQKKRIFLRLCSICVCFTILQWTQGPQVFFCLFASQMFSISLLVIRCLGEKYIPMLKKCFHILE